MLDDTAIREFLRDDYPRIVNAIALITGDLSTAEDLVQEALVRALIRSEGGEAIDSLPAWVSVVALNLSRSLWRRVVTERRARARTERNPAIAHDDREADRLDVQQALAALPRRQREVAVLRYLLQMSTHEVADTLHVSEGTVKNSLAKARTALAASLRVDVQEEDDVQA